MLEIAFRCLVIRQKYHILCSKLLYESCSVFRMIIILRNYWIHPVNKIILFSVSNVHKNADYIVLKLDAITKLSATKFIHPKRTVKRAKSFTFSPVHIKYAVSDCVSNYTVWVDDQILHSNLKLSRPRTKMTYDKKSKVWV